MPKNNDHTPVLLREVLEALAPKAGESYLDMTAGYGGHAREILSKTKTNGTLVDRDSAAIAVLQNEFKSARIVHENFFDASEILRSEKRTYDMILVDLGVSSPHLDNAGRGFSIHLDGPLDMRMDNRQKLTADEIVNTYSETEITRILKVYGEEPKAKRIAHLIVENRPVTSTSQLAKIVQIAWPYGSRTHPATRTFQALRIAVNDELELLKSALPNWVSLLAPKGRLAIISFHSLEDEIVKKYFNEIGGDRYDASVRVLTKKPVTAKPDELVFNPRARSAKLRACQRK